MKLLIGQKHSTNSKILVDEKTVLFLEIPGSIFSEDIKERLIESELFETISDVNLSVKEVMSFKGKHFADFSSRLLDSTNFEGLKETCRDFARKFDCTNLCFYSGFPDLFKHIENGNSCVIPICSGKELYGILLAEGKEFDIHLLSLISDCVSFKARDLLIHNPAIVDNNEVREQHGEKLPVVLCGVNREVTKFIDDSLVFECEINEIRNVCRIHKPGLILISEDPMLAIEDVAKIACDMRDMYATQNAEIMYFSDCISESNLKKLECTRVITVSTALLDSAVFRTHISVMSEYRKRPLSVVYQTFNRALLAINDNLKLDVLGEEFFMFLGVSNYHLTNYSKYFLGTTLREYQMMVRIHEAKKLLRNSKKTIKEIYEACGFTNYNSFSKYFYRCVGCIPSVFIEKKRK